MSNNFWFDYYKNKKQEEDKNIKEHLQPSNITKDKTKDKKNSNIIKLLVGLLAIIILMILVNKTNKLPTTLPSKTSKESIPTNQETFKFKDYNYTFIIDLDTEDNKYTLNYKGSVIKKEDEGILTVNNIEANYLYKDGKYYTKENDTYILIDEQNVYPVIDYKYLNINNIYNYINKGTLEYTKTSNNIKENSYKVKVSDIITSNSNSPDYIIINYKESNEKIEFYIDYTNLIKHINDNIKSCNIKLQYDNII